MTRATVETFRRYLTLAALAGSVIGMLGAPALLSNCLIALVILGLLDPLKGLNPRWRARFPAFARTSLFWGLAGLYFLLLFGVWQTYDWGYYLERIRIKIPLLALPVVWPGLPEWDRPTVLRIRLVFVGIVALVTAGVLINYGLRFDEVNGMIKRGQAVPVPGGDHVRYSLLVAVATLVGVGNWLTRGPRPPLARLSLFLTVFLFLAQHLLAVRSGLVCAYAGLGVLLLWTAARRASLPLAIGGLLGLALLPVLAYAVVPSFRNKINYARYELFHRNPAEDDLEYSDEGRLTSIRLGLQVWAGSRVFGVGPGNLRAAMDARYAEVLPGTPGKRPHNQFVSALAGSGLVGLAVTLACFVLLGFGGGRWRDPDYFAVWTAFLLSCLVENTLEGTVGVSLFALILVFLGATGGRATLNIC